MIKIYSMLPIVAVLGILPLGHAWAQDSQVLSVAKLWTSCAQCHATPDARVLGDQGWLGLNRKTSCLTGPAAAPELREALIAYLMSEAPFRPQLVSGAKVAPGTGILKVPAVRGNAYLVAEQKDKKSGMPARLRLVWGASESGSILRVPEGRFRIVNYGFNRTDAHKDQWRSSCTPGEAAQVVEVSASKPAMLPVRGALHSQFSAVSTKKRFTLKFFPSDGNGNRMTLTRNAQLVTPQWAIQDVDGNAVDRGKFVVL